MQGTLNIISGYSNYAGYTEHYIRIQQPFNWTVCVPLKYHILMPDIQEAKCFEFTVLILPSPRSSKGGGAKNISGSRIFAPPPPPRFISV